MATQITDHVQQALDRLAQQFKGKPSVESMLSSLAGNVQEVETALWQLLTERSVDVAIGVHLDAIGEIVGQPRNALGDEDYRRFISARIAANRSRGTIPDVLRVANLVLNDPTAYLEIVNGGIATYVLRIMNVPISDATAEILMSFLRAITSAGVRAIMESSAIAVGATFKWDTAGRGWDSGAPFVDARD